MSITTLTSLVNTSTLSAMQLRKGTGEVLNRVFYRRESFVIERSGEPMAVVIPIADYTQFQKLKAEAKKRAGEIVDTIRDKTTALDAQEVTDELNQAISEHRQKNSG